MIIWSHIAAEKIKEGRNDLPKPLEGDAGSWSGMTQAIIGMTQAIIGMTPGNTQP